MWLELTLGGRRISAGMPSSALLLVEGCNRVQIKARPARPSGESASGSAQKQSDTVEPWAEKVWAPADLANGLEICCQDCSLDLSPS